MIYMSFSQIPITHSHCLHRQGTTKIMASAFILLFFALLSESSSLTQQATLPQPERDSSWPKKPLNSNLMMENPSLFSPRMDYDEWTPLGRGDPLKNDPTYDYVPPVLERVHYWMDPSKRTPDPPLSNSGLLVLGSRTESTFTTRPTTPRYQSFQSKESQADSRIDTSSLLDPFFKLMDVSQFNLNFNSNSNYKPVPNRIHRPHYQANKQRTQPPQALQRPPYTMLMPPPPPPPSPTAFQSTNYITTVPDKTQTTVPIPPTLNPPLTSKNATTINPTVLANTENVFKPVAISMPNHAETFENETQNEITVGSLRKTTTTTTEPSVVPGESTQRLKHAEKQEHHPTTLYTKFSHKENFKSQPRPPETDEKIIKKPTKIPQRYWETENRATITPPITTTKINTLTTDPMFKHYKQPSEPIKGPFYLIIQGHSKVKTYGASKNPVNKLLTSNEIKYDEEVKKNKFERKTRRLRYETITPGANNLDEHQDEMRSLRLTEVDNLESLEETFGKSNGGSSKKRYLGSNHRRKRFAYDSVSNKNRRLLSKKGTDEDCAGEGRNATLSADNLDLESLIAISDDYDPEDVANILLKEEGGQGSGFGGLALSIVSRSEKDVEEM